MTVAELIKKLETLDPNLHVFTSGYEGGFHYVEVSEKQPFCLNYYSPDEWWYGPHEAAAHAGKYDEQEYEQVIGIVL